MGVYAVLGATGTIGSLLAKELTRTGHQVCLLARDRNKLELLADELHGSLVGSSVVDFASSDSVREAIDAMLKSPRNGGTDEPLKLSGIVNCIGSLLLKPAHGTSDADFRQTVEANLFTAFATVRAAGLLMRQSGGSVVLFSSAAAEIGLQNHEAIAAAKAGIIGLARSAAATYAPNNLRVNVISPGLTRTELTRRIWENPVNQQASQDMHALGRLGEPKHIVSAALWLLSPDNDWVTGEVLHVDGGLSQLVPRRKANG